MFEDINKEVSEVSLKTLTDKANKMVELEELIEEKQLDFMKNREITIVYDAKNHELKEYEYQYSVRNFRYIQKDHTRIAWTLELENMNRYGYDLYIRDIEFYRTATLSRLRFKKGENDIDVSHYFDCEKSY